MIDVDSLKLAIIKLAIQGKLLKQIPEEGSGEAALKMAVFEKSEFAKKGLIRKEKNVEKIDPDEIPFDIPSSWVWIRLSQICSIESGGTPDRSNPKYWNGDVPWLKIGDIQSKKVESCSEYITLEGLNNSSAKIFKKGTLLYTIFATIGTVGILDFEAATNQAIAGLTFYGSQDIDYMYYVLVGLKDILVSKGHGMTQANINQSILKNVVIPLPPIDEQKRISKQLDLIFENISIIEKEQDNLTSLLKRFEAKLLTIAFKGQLVNQSNNGETGEELFKLIQKEKNELLNNGVIKKQKPLPYIQDDEIPYAIPDNWYWCRWGNVAFSIQYGFSAPAKETGRIRMVRISDIQNDEIMWDTVPFCDIPEQEIPDYLLEKNDILFARTGGTVGKSFLVQNVPHESIYAGYLIRTRYSKKLVPKFLYYFMKSNLYWDQLRDGTIATAQPNCNGQTLSKMLIPLPPFEEQERIVAKLEELLPICSKLIE